jgi:SAM-dependent methyltransferase
LSGGGAYGFAESLVLETRAEQRGETFEAGVLPGLFRYWLIFARGFRRLLALVSRRICVENHSPRYSIVTGLGTLKRYQRFTPTAKRYVWGGVVMVNLPDASYAQRTIKTPNPIARFGHRQRVRFTLQLIEEMVPAYSRIADFGAGDGYLLRCLGATRPDLELHGIADTMISNYPEITFNRDFSTLADGSLDAVTASEAMENMLDSEIMSFFQNVRRVLRPGGLFIVSVPIVNGGSLPFKELTRKLLRQQHPSEYTLLESVRALVGLPVERPVDRRPTHKGSDFRVLRPLLERSFAVEKIIVSPFRLLPWWLNSQIFFCLRSYPGATRGVGLLEE